MAYPPVWEWGIAPAHRVEWQHHERTMYNEGVGLAEPIFISLEWPQTSAHLTHSISHHTLHYAIGL